MHNAIKFWLSSFWLKLQLRSKKILKIYKNPCVAVPPNKLQTDTVQNGAHFILLLKG